VQLRHVSAGEPGIFGTLDVRDLYMRALGKAREVANEGRPVVHMTAKKAEEVKSIAENKAEDYLRVTNWLHMVAPDVISGSAAEATPAKLSSTKFEIQEQVMASIGAHAPLTDALRNWNKANCSMLRTLITGLATRKVLDNSVDVILSRSPFKERMAVAKKSVRVEYLVESSPSCTSS